MQTQVEELMSGDPCRNLWASVVKYALNCAKAGDKESLNFFKSSYSSLPWICTMLGLDLDDVREGVAKSIRGEL